MQLPSSSFIPTINAITSSQELQWMIQPAILASKPGHCLPSHPYQPLDISSSLGPGSHTRLGVIRTVGNTHGRSRRSDQVTVSKDTVQEDREALTKGYGYVVNIVDIIMIKYCYCNIQFLTVDQNINVFILQYILFL